MTVARPQSVGARRPPAVSFEVFPPKTDAQATALTDTVDRLARFRPRYVSVTYGAGGTSQDRSFGALRHIAGQGVEAAAHITCAGAGRDAVRAALDLFRAQGVNRFVALRGDPPGGLCGPYAPHPQGFRDTADLVRALKDAGARDVYVSAYPERHPDSADWQVEIATLQRKVDAGADGAITQFFYDNDLYERYLERVRRAGIGIQIVPGLMPVHAFSAVCTFARRCGSTIPPSLTKRFAGLDPDSPTHGLVAAAVAAEQVADLMARGVDAFHIYTLNRPELAEAICRFCGVGQQAERAAA